MCRDLRCLALGILLVSPACSDDDIDAGDPDGAVYDDGGLIDPPPFACSGLYDPELLPTFEIEIAPAEWTAMVYEYEHWEERQALGLEVKVYHPLIAFRYQDEVIANAAIRLRGNPLNGWTDPKMQFQISFNELDPAGRFHGLRKLLLDAPRYNKSFLRDRLALSWLRDLGVPASCANNARLDVNGAYYGLYTSLEKIDREFLERNFVEPDGNLWERGFELETNEEAPREPNRIDDFWAAQDDAAAVAALVDLDQALLEWAAEAMIPHYDGYWAAGGNFLVYDEPGRGFVWIPWDLDSSFEVVPMDADPLLYWRTENGGVRPHFNAVMADPAWRAEYLAKLRVAVDAYDPAVLQARLDAWAAQIATSVDEDPNKQFTTEQHQTALGNLRGYFELRRAFVEQWLDGQ